MTTATQQKPPTIWLKATKEFSCSVPEYWALPPHKRPRSLQGLLRHVQRKAGIWCIQELDKNTGECLKMQVCENNITDNGALAMFKNTMNASAGGIAVANIIAVSQSIGHTTLSASIASGGTVTSISVGSLTGPTIPSGTTLCINPGPNQFLVSTTQAISGAGTITVASRSGPASTIASGSHVRYATSTDIASAGSSYSVSSTLTTDVSSLSAPVSYTAALPSGQFTISGSGNGNRQLVVTNSGNYLFSTSSNSNPSTATVADYTDAWLVNANPVAAPVSGIYNTFVHVPLDTLGSVTANTTLQITITEKL